MIKLSEHRPFCFKTETSVEKMTQTKIESFLISIFDLNKTWQKTILFQTFPQRVCFIVILINHLRQTLKLWKMLTHWILKWTRTNYRQKFVSTHNPRQNIWSKYKAKQNSKKARNFDICFLDSFYHFCKRPISYGENGV